MHRVWQMMKKRDEHKVAVDARKHFFRERKSYNIKCNTMYLTEKDEGNSKGACGENIVMKHKHHVLKREQIAVKRDCNIIPSKEEKMK